MHPADELAPFARLIADGKCAADVPPVSGVSEAAVNRCLALARVGPVLLQQYRVELLDLETLQALTLPLSPKAEAKLHKLRDKLIALENQLSEEDEDANETIY